jgi:hypothetical protein
METATSYRIAGKFQVSKFQKFQGFKVNGKGKGNGEDTKATIIRFSSP